MFNSSPNEFLQRVFGCRATKFSYQEIIIWFSNTQHQKKKKKKREKMSWVFKQFFFLCHWMRNAVEIICFAVKKATPCIMRVPRIFWLCLKWNFLSSIVFFSLEFSFFFIFFNVDIRIFWGVVSVTISRSFLVMWLFFPSLSLIPRTTVL